MLKKLSFISVSAFAFFILATGCSIKEIQPLKVFFFDLYGESVLIQTPLGKNILIDAGENEALSKYLLKLGVTGLDVVVLTHPHIDHYSGLKWVVDNPIFSVEKIYHNNDLAKLEDPRSDEFIAGIMFENPKNILSRGDLLDIDPSLSFTVLWPETNDEIALNETDSYGNDNSVVLKLVYGNISFLFTGDCSAKCEYGILENGDDINANVLKAGHHGMIDASTGAFLSKVDPEIILYSVKSKYTQYDRFIKMARVYNTLNNGNIQIVSDGVDYNVYSEK